MASLLTGAVTSASNSPRRQRFAPSRKAARAAWAASGEPAGSFPGSAGKLPVLPESAKGFAVKNFPLPP